MSSTYITEAVPIGDYAIIVDPKDNVAVVKKQTFPGLEVGLPDGRIINVTDVVPAGHRFATREIPEGEFVLQYGQPIGTSLGIREGKLISHDNMSNEVPLVRGLSESLYTPPPDYIPERERQTFMG